MATAAIKCAGFLTHILKYRNRIGSASIATII
jgi:hypothetical protein